jgi:hypothetical protein
MLRATLCYATLCLRVVAHVVHMMAREGPSERPYNMVPYGRYLMSWQAPAQLHSPCTS